MSTSSFDESRLLNSDYQLDTRRKNAEKSWLRTAIVMMFVVNAIFLLAITGGIYKLANHLKFPSGSLRSDCFDDTLLNPPIVWERRTFNSTVDEAQGIVVDRFGPSTPTMSADWGSVLDVGEIRLSAEEAARLPKGTAHVYGPEKGYAGVLEVFHQLHCLNRIRKKFYKESSPVDDKGDSKHLSQWHDKHCFEYLWQTLLCHADVSVMTVGWNEKQQACNADFAVTKQCRNFDAIHNWAKAREAKFPPPGDEHPGRIEGM
ncbi:hypothetical protein OPT61_g1377 [Boeremia exigua]|uniref:Uncharacterized protein n=1 Tax=Boeremia exigua TaxID=749465 RepID=A0ACC2IQF2_9PLEO|nr:hypothetical protein OPT61_g1377 [Boeremia exigua]